MTGTDDDGHAVRRTTVKGATSVALARMGALIEVVAQPAYTWMFGLATYGLYMVLWSLVNLVENIFDLGVTSGLQRVLPQADEAHRAKVVRGALVLGVAPNLLVAAAAFLAAPWLATVINVAADDLDRLRTAIRLFAWALPLWAIVEVATSALRALHAFGPEIRVRLLWEQLARLVMAAILWAAGVDTLGLLIAHIVSLTFTAGSALRLLGRYVTLRDVLAARVDRTTYRELFLSGTSVLPANILNRAFGDLPTVVANLLAPGAAGASAAGLYAIARKVASIPQIVRQTFAYVLAPIASAAARGDEGTIQALYGFAVRMSLLLAMPVAVMLIAAGTAALGLFAKGSEAALPILIVLTAARGIESSLGPAAAIQQVIGARGLPVLNSAIGLAVATAVVLIWHDDIGVLAIALAVAAGQVGTAALSVWQLRRDQGLHAFVAPFGRMLAAVALVCAGIAGAGLVTQPLPGWVHGTAVLVAWLALMWVGARTGLSASDKAALGGAGKRLRL